MNIYLTFGGNCRAAMEFYRSVFGGEFLAFQTFADAPGGMPVEASSRNLVMHSSLEVDGATLMASDHASDAPLAIGNNFSIALEPPSRQRCDELFARLAQGGTVTMPMQETFWGAYFGSLRDRFGIGWMLNHELAPPR